MSEIRSSLITTANAGDAGSLRLTMPKASGRDALANKLLDSASIESAGEGEELREAFHDFVGQTFFGQMLASMRATQNETPYFNGGRAEKIFQGQLDQVLTEELSEASADKIADPMFELFNLKRA